MLTRGKPNYDLSLVINSILHLWQVFALLKFSNTPSNWATITTDAQHQWLHKINSLVLGRCDCDFKLVIFKLIIKAILSISCEIALKVVNAQELTGDQSTLFQVMAWCHQATSHYLNQCWQSYMMPYGITRLQWVNKSSLMRISTIFTISMARNESKCLYIFLHFLKIIQHKKS